MLEQGTNTPVGLYFAGSTTTGVMNPILDVYLALGVFVDTDTTPAIATAAELQQQARRIPVDERIKTLKTIQARYESRILSVPGVSGIGIGKATTDGDLAIMVFCDKLTDRLRNVIPTEIEGARVRLMETGAFVAH